MARRPVGARLTDLAAALVEADEEHVEAQRGARAAEARVVEANARLEKATAAILKAKEDLENFVRDGK